MLAAALYAAPASFQMAATLTVLGGGAPLVPLGLPLVLCFGIERARRRKEKIKKF